jgi:hypothetical protein
MIQGMGEKLDVLGKPDGLDKRSNTPNREIDATL